MLKRLTEKSIVGKLLICLAALAIAVICLPMSAQTVSAEEPIPVSISYVYVNTNGDTSLYREVHFVPVGTTWGDFFNYYDLRYNSGIITDANTENTWIRGIQNVLYNDESYYTDQIEPFDAYTDSALVTIYGYPSTYRPAYISFSYFVNDEYMDSGIGGDFFVPASCVCGSEESFVYAEKARHLYTFFDEYCNQPGATITWKGTPASTEGGWDSYDMFISVSTESSSTDTSYTAVDTTNYFVPLETSYTTDSGEAFRRIAAEGNEQIALDGAQEFIPTGSKFTSTQLSNGDIYSRAAELVAQKIGRAVNFKVFEMNLADASNTAIHQLNGYVNVTLPIPEGFSSSNGKLLMVYRVEDDGTLTKCTTATANGYLTFATNHFSTYVLVEQTGAVSPKTGDASVAFPLVFASMAVVICGICFAKNKVLCK